MTNIESAWIQENADAVATLITTFDQVMTLEGVDPRTRRRIVNILKWGHPEGDHTATIASPEEWQRQLADSASRYPKRSP